MNGQAPDYTFPNILDCEFELYRNRKVCINEHDEFSVRNNKALIPAWSNFY